MTTILKEGLTKTARINVDAARTISFMGDEGRVYATPELVRDIEHTCRDLLLEHVDEGQDSVGTHIEASHTAATPLGMWVDITVTLNSLDGRAANFEVSAQDQVEQICHGSHSRFIVDVAKTIERLRKKADSVEAA